MKKIISILTISVIVLSANNINDKIKVADKAYDTKNYKQAFQIYSSLVKNNNPSVEYELATMYHDGYAVKKDITKAIELYTRASKQGHTLAKVELGILYLNGNHLNKNYKKAFTLFQDASKTGNDIANYYLGRMYYNGYGVEKNHTLAKKYYDVAAKQGYDSAMYALGTILKEEANDNKADLKKAYDYFKASSENIPWSNYELAVAFLDGNKVIKKNTSKGMFYLSKAVDMHDILATTLLAKIYHDGLYNQNINLTKSIQLYDIVVTEYEHIYFDGSDEWKESLAINTHLK